jgi:hypothetical protein
MNTFRVWLQPTGNLCRVRVDGMQNACWLLTRLSHSFVFKTLEPIRQEQSSSICAFQVLCRDSTRAGLKTLLESIPPVQLMAD